MHSKVKNILFDTGAFLLGGAVYSISINIFTAPNHIAPGGATGVATILNYLFHTPIGTMIMIINLPLFIWAIIKFGMKFTAKTIAATLTLSLMIDFGALFLFPYKGNNILAAIFGGLLSGIGLSMFFMRGATTGGSDLLARIIKGSFRHIPIGQLILIIDIFVLAAAAIIYKNIESGLYAVIAIFTSTKVIDGMLYGIKTGKILMIITKNPADIKEAVVNQIQRGATSIKSQGAYTGSESEILLCAVRRSEVYKVRDIVRHADPKAFIIIAEANDIIGEGWSNIEGE